MWEIASPNSGFPVRGPSNRRWRLDSPRVQLIQTLFELMETDSIARASEELLAHSAEDVVFEPLSSHGRVLKGRDELRDFWESFEDEGSQLRAGAYSLTEEGDSVVVSGWVRTIKDGRLADTQSRWIYRFNEDDEVVSARVERG
jgi:ketosteroid isomerase-like protein